MITNAEAMAARSGQSRTNAPVALTITPQSARISLRSGEPVIASYSMALSSVTFHAATGSVFRRPKPVLLERSPVFPHRQRGVEQADW